MSWVLHELPTIKSRNSQPTTNYQDLSLAHQCRFHLIVMIYFNHHLCIQTQVVDIQIFKSDLTLWLIQICRVANNSLLGFSVLSIQFLNSERKLQVSAF